MTKAHCTLLADPTQSDALVSSNTDEDDEGKCNQATSSSLEGEGSPLAAVGRKVGSPGNSSYSAHWYPKLLTRPASSEGGRTKKNRFESFPTGLEISAMSVVSLYGLDDEETKSMDR